MVIQIFQWVPREVFVPSSAEMLNVVEEIVGSLD